MSIWNESGIKGVVRFLDRVWQLAQEMAGHSAEAAPDRAFARRMHETIARVTADMAAFKFNTAVAALMGWLNDLEAARDRPVGGDQWRAALRTLALLLAPLAPFCAESIWHDVLGEDGSVHRQAWPAVDEAALARETVTVAVQVDGRVRGTVDVPAGSEDALLREAALALSNVQRAIGDRPVRRVIVVRERLVNVVTK